MPLSEFGGALFVLAWGAVSIICATTFATMQMRRDRRLNMWSDPTRGQRFYVWLYRVLGALAIIFSTVIHPPLIPWVLSVGTLAVGMYGAIRRRHADAGQHLERWVYRLLQFVTGGMVVATLVRFPLSTQDLAPLGVFALLALAAEVMLRSEERRDSRGSHPDREQDGPASSDDRPEERAAGCGPGSENKEPLDT